MAKFFVGQRVVVARPRDPRNKGLEGVIEAFGRWSFGDELPDGQFSGMFEIADVFCSFSKAYHGGLGNNAGPAQLIQLEPILYDGAQPIAESFEEMMGKLREGAVA